MDITSTWVDAPEHPGYKTTVIQRGNCIIHILRPQLTPEERAKRMAEIKKAAIQLAIETEKAKKRKAQNR